MTGPLVPASGALFGAWMKPASGAGFEDKMAMYESREAEIGRRFDILNRYYGFKQSFPTESENYDADKGRISSISWAGADTRQVRSGAFDNIIRQRARDVAAFGSQIFIRWFWEMDGKANLSQAHSPADFIAAFRRIKRIFDEEGADNAVWTWCVTAWGMTAGYAQQWYPGDAAVDWICANGYNYAPDRPSVLWRDWEFIYRPTHDFAVAHDKPMMAGEWGALERAPNEKANWILEAAETIKNEMPNLAAIIAFDERRYHAGDDRWYDWRVISSETAKLAFMTIARQPYFTTRTPVVRPTISIGDSTITENDTGIALQNFNVTLSAPTSETVTVSVKLVHRTTDAADVEFLTETISFEPGVTREVVRALVIGDLDVESGETFTITLDSPANATFRDSIGLGTIRPSDAAPATDIRIAASDITVVEGDAGVRVVGLGVTMSRPRRFDTTVAYGVVATGLGPGRYYMPVTTGTITIAAGSQNGSVKIVLLPNFRDDPDGKAVLVIANPDAGTISVPLGTLTVLDDDRVS